MALNPKLTKFTTISPILATFDAIDVSEGAGFINYNASSSSVTTTVTYFLTRDTNPSDEVYTFVNSGNTGAAVELFDADFDITFQVPKDMAKGTAYITLALGMGSEVTTEKSMFAKVTLLKNAAVIGSQTTSRTVTRPNPTPVTEAYSEVVTVPYTLSSETHFAIDDVLRVNVEVWGTQAASTCDFGLGHDPADRNDPRGTGVSDRRIFEDDQSTKSVFSIPFILKNL